MMSGAAVKRAAATPKPAGPCRRSLRFMPDDVSACSSPMLLLEEDDASVNDECARHGVCTGSHARACTVAAPP